MKNILITGGLGYIGGRVATYLKEKEPGSNIFLTSRKKNENLPFWTSQFKVLQMEVNNDESIHDCLRDFNIDIIIHLAALNEIDSMENPELALEINTKGTYKLLNHARINNIGRFIYLSTFHVYGETPDSVITEETPTKPFHPYAITHRAAEDFVTFSNHYHGMKTLILRLSNSYGYPMDRNVNRWTLVFNDLCRQVVTNGKIVLKSSGKQYRDFVALSDVARAVHHFIFTIPDKWKDGFYNLGGNCSMSILEVAQKVSDVYKKEYKNEIIKIERKSNDSNLMVVQTVKYSIEKLIRTGFTLKGDMISEIKRTIDLCQEFVK